MNVTMNPPDPGHDERRRCADLALLRDYAEHDRTDGMIRRRWVIRGSATLAAVAAAGALTAVATGALSPKHAAIRDVVRCYATITTSTSPGFSTEVVSLGARDQASAAIESCRGIWQVGGLHHSKPYITGPTNNGAPDTTPAPQLTACVMSNGEVAVYPGGALSCRTLGLAPSAG